MTQGIGGGGLKWRFLDDVICERQLLLIEIIAHLGMLWYLSCTDWLFTVNSDKNSTKQFIEVLAC